jgi:tRNA-specific 2-thiouridylase
MNVRIAVAVSGGVDSMMAAHLLQKQGHDLIGLHFITGYETEPADVSAVAVQLGIPYRVVDLRNDFEHTVVDYFVRMYMAGRTPNPCLVCNPAIKFGLLLEFARRIGAVQMATGHYARVIRNNDGRYRLLRGVDPLKDQSYFLAFLSRDQLAHAVFPLGELTKSVVKKLAAAENLQPATRSESQDVCFISDPNYGDFLARRPELHPQPGPIVDVHGNVLGTHPGLHRFTVGQRRGINCPAAAAYYVLELDAKNNRLVVGPKSDTFSRTCEVESINWLRPEPDRPLRVHTRVRYRHVASPSWLYPAGNAKARIDFDQPQSAVTPGQGAVFYSGDEVLGGGFIRDSRD